MREQRITTVDDVDTALREYYLASGSPRIGSNYRFEDTVELAARVGNPQERLKVVHVAGTSGKTSTAYYISALLQQSGQKVGLTVSPHITSIAERVQIGGRPLDDATFARYFAEYLPLATANGTIRPSFFELMMLFALWVFAREGVDYAVIETGMGGTYDSSNICHGADKLCVITDIGLDHTHILGNTLGKIAEQKAGIIADGNIACMYRQGSEVMRSVEAAVTKHQATLVLADEARGATYFDRNFQLAKTAYRRLVARDGLRELDESQLAVARATTIPGRLESFRLNGANFVLDGAHNEQKLRAMFATLDALHGQQTWATIVALKHDKEISNIVPLIAAHALSITTSEYAKSQDIPFAAMPAGELAACFGDQIPVHVEPSLEMALRAVMASGKRRVLVIGSFYAVGEARKWLIDHGARVQ